MKKLLISEAKELDLVDYLAANGHHPTKIRQPNYWYLSPLRSEKTASFKVDRHLNRWYDHGLGQGGNIIDFGIRYFNCCVSDFLAHLTLYRGNSTLSFQQPVLPQPLLPGVVKPEDEKKERIGGAKIIVLEVRPLAAKSLVNYLQKRCIPLPLANQFCHEVDFKLYDKKYTVIGFANKAGGYELRSPGFKGSSSPKDVSFIDNGGQKLTVFEGCFSFLSYLANQQVATPPLTNFLVLNSLAFFEKSREQMESHQSVHLLLDRDEAGKKCTQQALQWSEKYSDQSILFQPYKDMNEWLVKQQELRTSQGLRAGRHF
jgi:hypothetical protein